jgi:hypothetical protein
MRPLRADLRGVGPLDAFSLVCLANYQLEGRRNGFMP